MWNAIGAREKKSLPMIMNDDEIEALYLKYLRKQKADQANSARGRTVAFLQSKLWMLLRQRRGSIA